MEPYNNSPELSQGASRALLQRSREIIAASREDDNHLANQIWANLGFHVATVKLEQAGVTIPKGPEMQCLIALILASEEHCRAQGILDAVIDASENPL